MLTIIVATGVAACVFFVCERLNLHLAWCVAAALAALMLVQLGMSLILRAMSKKINLVLQNIMQDTQAKIQMLQNQFARRPLSQKDMMKALEREQYSGIDRMIEALKLYEPLCRWNFMMKKQVATMKMIFLFQKKKFDEADKLMPGCVFFDSQSVSMKMARMYMTGATDIDKFFKKRAARLKADDAVLPYSLYAWILVKQEKYEEAIKVLSDAKKKSSNEVIAKNLDTLLNQKYKHFSNSRLGDAWYSLYLEEPKMPKMQQQQQQMRYRR